jgi:hypothetical protein
MLHSRSDATLPTVVASSDQPENPHLPQSVEIPSPRRIALHRAQMALAGLPDTPYPGHPSETPTQREMRITALRRSRHHSGGLPLVGSPTPEELVLREIRGQASDIKTHMQRFCRALNGVIKEAQPIAGDTSMHLVFSDDLAAKMEKEWNELQSMKGTIFRQLKNFSNSEFYRNQRRD